MDSTYTLVCLVQKKQDREWHTRHIRKFTITKKSTIPRQITTWIPKSAANPGLNSLAKMLISMYNEAQGFLKSPTMLMTEKKHNIDNHSSSLPLGVELTCLGVVSTNFKRITRN